MSNRSLYQCFNARCQGVPCRIVCAKGHRLGNADDGTVPITRLKRGEPLEYSGCQGCPDYDEMGGFVAKEDRGWR